MNKNNMFQKFLFWTLKQFYCLLGDWKNYNVVNEFL